MCTRLQKSWTTTPALDRWHHRMDWDEDQWSGSSSGRSWSLERDTTRRQPSNPSGGGRHWTTTTTKSRTGHWEHDVRTKTSVELVLMKLLIMKHRDNSSDCNHLTHISSSSSSISSDNEPRLLALHVRKPLFSDSIIEEFSAIFSRQLWRCSRKSLYSLSRPI